MVVAVDVAQRLILAGEFPEYLIDEFAEMLDYFGQSPIIVRSSSLLEDSFGNAFAGKYDSVFCVNQGTREQRLQALLNTVRQVYASTMSEKALRYRVGRGLLDRDEQMALLVMRVSGARYNDKFFPQIAGVGFSFNPYVWYKDIDPRAGVIRLVFGLGTRAVDRADDDYTRLVALNAPWRRPESNFDEVCEYSQHRVDYLNLSANRLVSGHFLDLVKENLDLPLEMVASRDDSIQREQAAPNHVLTFDGLLSATPFVDDFITHVIFVREDVIAKRPEAVRAFLKGWFETIAFMKANKLQADWEGIDQAPNEALVNALSMMSPYGAAEKQALLEAPDLKTRAELLVAITEIELAKKNTEGEPQLQ